MGFFNLSKPQKMLQDSAKEFLSRHCSLERVREVLESEERYARELWKGAAELGWLGIAIPEEYGGDGLGHLELAVIAEEVGRALAPIPFSSSVYLATEALLLAGSPEQRQRYLPRLASGEIIGTLALAEKPGQNNDEGIEALFEDGRLQGEKWPVPDGDIADFAIVGARGAKGLSLLIVELDVDGVERRPLRSIDPSRSQARLRFERAPAELLGAEGKGATLIERLLDRAAVLMAFEQLGGASRAFEITKSFALERYAFGRPIASFQVLKHRFADLWCDIELTRSNSYYGAWALSTDAPELAVVACIARIAACDSFAKVAEEMIQIHGGVGFTWEYDCHLFYRRAKLTAAALGSASSWKHKLIDRLCAPAA